MSILAKFDPIPGTCGLIRTSPEAAVESAIIQLLSAQRRALGLPASSDISDSCVFNHHAITSGLESALEALVPLTTAITTRHLFVKTANPDWIVYFNNYKMPGSDTNLVRILGTELKTRAVLAVRRDETIVKVSDVESHGFYGAYILRFYNGSMTPERSIELVHYEDGWTFEQEGTPYPFEHTDRYSARRKRDRFDGPLMEEYLAAINLHPYSDDFYRVTREQPAHLVERVDRDETVKQRIRYYSLEEAKIFKR